MKTPAATGWAGFLSAVVLMWMLAGCAATLPSSGTVERPAPPPKAPAGTKPYRVGETWYHPLPHARGFSQQGLASWYGEDFHGKKTSNGETYNMYAMTAAHKTLPLGTWVRVKNLNNGQWAEVRINDRGPFVRGRIIDLSFAAARRLDIVEPGTAPVEIVALGPGGTGAPEAPADIDYTKGNFTFQVGAFQNLDNAERLKATLSAKYKNVHIVPYETEKGTFYRVRVGRCSTLEQADSYEKILMADGFSEVFIVAE